MKSSDKFIIVFNADPIDYIYAVKHFPRGGYFNTVSVSVYIISVMEWVKNNNGEFNINTYWGYLITVSCDQGGTVPII